MTLCNDPSTTLQRLAPRQGVANVFHGKLVWRLSLRFPRNRAEAIWPVRRGHAGCSSASSSSTQHLCAVNESGQSRHAASWTGKANTHGGCVAKKKLINHIVVSNHIQDMLLKKSRTRCSSDISYVAPINFLSAQGIEEVHDFTPGGFHLEWVGYSCGG